MLFQCVALRRATRQSEEHTQSSNACHLVCSTPVHVQNPLLLFDSYYHCEVTTHSQSALINHSLNSALPWHGSDNEMRSLLLKVFKQFESPSRKERLPHAHVHHLEQQINWSSLPETDSSWMCFLLPVSLSSASQLSGSSSGLPYSLALHSASPHHHHHYWVFSPLVCQR